ncbi:MAG: hypothetical protein MUF21_08780 [Gemmatimonadaceae bacterium]|nr:hypothetical protein [Gemmatimonadaceae bacterium]
MIERGTHARQRRAQLVRGVGEEAPLLRERAIEAIEERVHGAAEASQLVARVGDRQPVAARGGGDALRGVGHRAHGAQRAPGEPPAAGGAHEREQRHRDQQREVDLPHEREVRGRAPVDVHRPAGGEIGIECHERVADRRRERRARMRRAPRQDEVRAVGAAEVDVAVGEDEFAAEVRERRLHGAVLGHLGAEEAARELRAPGERGGELRVEEAARDGAAGERGDDHAERQRPGVPGGEAQPDAESARGHAAPSSR